MYAFHLFDDNVLVHPVPERPTNLPNRREESTALAVEAGGVVWTF